MAGECKHIFVGARSGAPGQIFSGVTFNDKYSRMEISVSDAEIQDIEVGVKYVNARGQSDFKLVSGRRSFSLDIATETQMSPVIQLKNKSDKAMRPQNCVDFR